MIKVLILTCGTNANFHIAKVLKEKFGSAFQIIGTDINKEWEIPCSPYLDFFHTSPLISNANYYQFVLGLCKEYHIDFIIPCFDADLLLFYEGNSDLKELGVKSLGINSQLKDIYQNKRKANDFLYVNGFPLPKLFSFDNIEADGSYFVKPIDGYGSLGARVMKGADIDEKIASNNMIEEMCFNPEITLECFLYKGKVFSVARQRLAQKSGVCTKARVFYDKELTKIAQSLANIIGLPRLFNLQFMLNTNGQYVITDLNLRAAGGMSMSYAAGWDSVSALASVMLGMPDDEVCSHVLPVKQEQYVMRAYTDIVTKKVEKRIAFDLDGTLLNSKDRHTLVMDTVLKEFGISLDTDDLLSFKSEGLNNIDWLLSKGINKEVAARIQSRWIELVENAEYLAKDVLIDGVKDRLFSLSKRNELFLITARSNEKNANEQIERLGLTQYFTQIKIVRPGSESTRTKSSFLIDNRIDMMVGDTETDYHAAINAHCEYYLLNSGFRSEVFWKSLGVNSYQDLNLLVQNNGQN